MRDPQPFTTFLCYMIKSRLVLRRLKMLMLAFLYPLKRLSSLGIVVSDFSIPKLSFTSKGQPISFTRKPKLTNNFTSFHQLCHMAHQDSISTCFLLTISPINQPTHPKPNISALVPIWTNLFNLPSPLFLHATRTSPTLFSRTPYSHFSQQITHQCEIVSDAILPPTGIG